MSMRARLTTTVVVTAVAATATGGIASAAVKPAAPSAKFTLSTAAPTAGATVQVDVHTTKLPKGDKLKSATISFGDGSKAVALKALSVRPKHVYAKAGTYTVTLTVVDKHKKKSVITKRIVVKAKPVVTTVNTGDPTKNQQPTQTANALPIVVPPSATPSTPISALGLSGDQLGTLSALLATPLALVPGLPVGFLGLLPAGDLSLPSTGLPALPGLAGLPAVSDLLSLLTALPGLPVSLPTTVNPISAISSLPTSVLSGAQLSTVSALFGVPVTTLQQLPIAALSLLRGNLLQFVTSGTSVVPAGLPITPAAGLQPTALISSLGLSSGVITELAGLLSTPAGVLPQLPVGFLALLPTSALTLPTGGLPSIPGLAGLPLVSDLVSLLPGLSGLPLTLPTSLDPTSALGALPTSLLSATQLGTLSTLFGVPTSLVAQLPVSSLGLLRGNLLNLVSSLPVVTSGLPITPAAGLTPTTLISSLGLSSGVLSQLSGLLGVPSSVLPTLPVGFLSLLPSSALTLPTGGLPSIPGLAGLPLVGNLVALLPTLSGLPIALPTGLSPTQALGDLPTTVLSAVQLGTLSTLFGVPVGTVEQLPVSVLSLLRGNLLGTAAPITSLPLPALPLSIPSGLSPTSLISSLGLSSGALDSVSSLLSIPTATLQTLPVGILKLLPAGDLSLPAGGLPALPGLGSLPLVGNLLGMLLSGLPVHLPTGTNPLSLISSLPGTALSVLQLTTLSTFFGIPASVLSTLPVNVLTLLPTGLLSGL